MIRLSIDQLDTMKVTKDVQALVDKAPDVFAEEAGEELRDSSYWPVDTGASLKGFRTALKTGPRALIAVFNAEPYAEYVEERTGAASKTLKEGLEKIVKRVSDRLDGET